MTTGRFVLLVLLLVVNSLGPGLVLVRRLRWSLPEKLAVAVGASLLIVYLASFAIFLLGLPPSAHFVVSGAAALLLALSWRDLARLLRHRSARRYLAAFGFLFLWSLALLALVRHYSGGLWAADWLEHYQRALFFLDRLPRETLFIGRYALPARPPLMNQLAAHYLAQVGRTFDVFQVVFLFLNLLIVLPLMLAASALVRGASRRTLLLAGFLAASPILLQNVTWTWTKLGAGFYTVLAFWFYLRAWRKRDPVRMTVAFAALAAGLLAHYSVGPYALFLALHYVTVVLRQGRPRWRELLTASLCSLAVLLPWLAWSLSAYGPRATLTSNTTVSGASAVSLGDNLVRMGMNLVNTVVPHPFREAGRQYLRTQLDQPSRLGYLRDYTFLIYQVNVVAAVGSVAGPLALYLMYRRMRTASLPARPELRFWTAFVVIVFVLGVAAASQGDEVGLAHVCLQPMVLLGVVFVAASVPDLPAWMRRLALAGCAVDFTLGVLLHFAMENRVGTLVASPAGLQLVNSAGLSQSAALAWAYRAARSMVFFGDHFGALAASLEVALALAYALILVLLWRAVLTGPRGRAYGSCPRDEKSP